MLQTIIYRTVRMDYLIESPEAMQDLGKALLAKGSKFLISGELGAGKTTLIKGLAAALKIDPDQVQSPTYTYLHIYDDRLLHIDMRRIDAVEQVKQLGLLELIDQYPFVALERPKREDLYADSSRVRVKIGKKREGREITVS